MTDDIHTGGCLCGADAHRMVRPGAALLQFSIDELRVLTEAWSQYRERTDADAESADEPALAASVTEKLRAPQGTPVLHPRRGPAARPGDRRKPRPQAEEHRRRHDARPKRNLDYPEAPGAGARGERREDIRRDS